MRRAVLLGVVVLGACVLPEFPDYETRFLRPDAGSAGGGGGGADAGQVPRCGATTPLTAEQLLEVAVRAASCGVTEGTATPNEWPRLMLDWARVLQRAPDYEGWPGAVVDVPRDDCGRLKCLARATSCAQVYACYGGAPWDAGSCSTGERCENGKAMHCDETRGPAWAENCSAQGQPCAMDGTGHAVCGTTCSMGITGQCLSQGTTLARCNAGVGRTYVCPERCVAGATGAAVCAPATGGECTGSVCNGDEAIDCPTRSVGDRLDCAALPGGTCAQLPSAGPVLCAPKSGGSCAGTLGFFTSCDGTTLVVCANNVESRLDCAALGFSACVNGGPAGLCR